ncbi:WAP-type four-disulfide core [Brachionus plicatilis]|uniref:WAP-type four-disulfide core n=1 Tax=Brachionus plicatilis TaxID=10195 RepID=A0A3M7SCU5_BRAPC|nr:WAP-type four-disulfide core [Brachionus plicatilis]
MIKIAFLTIILALSVINSDSAYVEKPGSCPLDLTASLSGCTFFCITDDQCPENLKCCATDCGKQCAMPI